MTSMVMVMVMVILGEAQAAPAPTPDAGGAASPPAEGAAAEADGGTASGSTEDLEAAVLGAPAPPAKAAESEPPARPPPARPVRHRQRQRQDDAVAPSDEPAAHHALAIELGTAGFASGALQGGLFLGVRLAGGTILGGGIDYASSSVSVSGGMTSNSPGTSASTFRLNTGARFSFLQAADRRVELIGVAEIGFVRASSEVMEDGVSVSSAKASGLTAAVGPGLRLWVHEAIAIGYTVRLRLDQLSGDAGALPSAPGQASPTASASSANVRFEGAFQILGVF